MVFRPMQQSGARTRGTDGARHDLRWWLQLVEADSVSVWHRNNAELSKSTGWSIEDVRRLGATHCRDNPRPGSDAAYRKGMAATENLGTWITHLLSR